MKRVTSLLLFSLVFFDSGCKKENVVDSTSIEGLWELRQESGMMVINYPAGNGNTIRFSADRYEKVYTGQLTNGQYRIVEDISVEAATCLVIPAGTYTKRIVYDNSNAQKIFMQLSGDTLRFVSGCFAYDAGSFTTYIRK